MYRKTQPSFPPSHPSPYRHLGGGGGDGPVRVQMIIALVAGLILVAVPLYFFRRPRPEPIPSADAAMTVDAGAHDRAPGVVFDSGATSRVTVSPVTVLRCQNPGPGKTPPERCDRVRFFEDGLAKAIRENVLCAPALRTGGTVSFVFDFDFKRKRTSLAWGKSSTVKRDRAAELIRCVERALPTPDWGTIPHQYQRYKVNVVATYPPGTNVEF